MPHNYAAIAEVASPRRHRSPHTPQPTPDETGDREHKGEGESPCLRWVSVVAPEGVQHYFLKVVHLLGVL